MNEPRYRCGLVFLTLLLAAALAGCGGATPEAAKTVAPAKSEVLKAAAPAAVAASKPAAGTKPAKKLSLNPFQMPEIPDEFLPPKEEPKPVESTASTKQTERPKLRLLGFSNVDGFKALVELKGDVQAVEAGDVIEGVQVVSVEPPNVTFQFASSRWATKLFDQPWHNEQTGVASSPGASRAFASQSRSTPRANAPAYATRAPIAGGIRGPAGPRMLDESTSEDTPEISENATPSITRTPAIPGMPTGAGGVGLPGLGSLPGMPPPGMPPPGAIPGGPGTTPGTPGGPGATSVGND